MNTSKQNTESCIIEVAKLFSLINKQRKLYNLQPIEDSALATRCTLRANVGKLHDLDFNRPEILLTGDETAILENILNEQFAIHLDGELKRLCSKAAQPTQEFAPLPRSVNPTEVPPTKDETGKGMGAKLKGLFGRK